MSEEEPCSQFVPHPIRKICLSCKKLTEDHPLSEKNLERIKQNLKVFEDQPEVTPDAQYSWTPPGCPKERLDEYFKTFSANEVPKHKSEGQKNRLKRMMRQIPLLDLSPENCRAQESEFIPELKNYTKKLQTDVIRLGVIKEWSKEMAAQCPKCLSLFEPNELVTATSSQAYHPACFVCTECREILTDLVYCSDVDGTVFCIRHYNDQKKKRCHVCDELIFSAQFVVAGDNFYHKNHLLCFACDKALEGSKSPEKDGELYCAPCYEDMFCNDCTECHERIKVGSKFLAYRDKNWHYGCFTCCKCDAPMADTAFEIVGEDFLCKDCFDKEYAPQCKGCGINFNPDDRVVKYEDHIFHVPCFKCVDCQESIGTKGFSSENGEIYCKSCHQRKFGIRCFHCNSAIVDDRAIMHDKKPYHEECFTCYGCKANIGSTPFKTINGNWYCMHCYGDKFCKKCHSCEEPIILGIDEDDALYSYEEYCWHASCFICSVCKTPLAKTPFTIMGKEMVCESCVNEKDEKSSQGNVPVAKQTEDEGDDKEREDEVA